MIILELFGISLIGGVILGVGLRFYDDWSEKRRIEQIKNL